MESIQLTSTPTRLPAALWESLQEICWRHDNKFLDDASRILGISASEIKRKVLGVRGVVSAVITTDSSWYEGTQCPIMMPTAGEMWRRCVEPAEYNGFCWAHKKGRGMRHDCSYFHSLPKRHPWRFEGELVWVRDDGNVMRESGEELKDVRIDITNGICYDSRPVPSPWTKAELTEAKEAYACARTSETDTENESEV
jgi:hypothetical protein